MHDTLHKVMNSLVQMPHDHKRTGAATDFAAKRAMLFYLSEFPERVTSRRKRACCSHACAGTGTGTGQG